MIGGGYFQFLGISVFFIHRKLRPMNEILSVWRNRVAPRENAPDRKKFRSGAFSFVGKTDLSAGCTIYDLYNMLLHQLIWEWRLR